MKACGYHSASFKLTAITRRTTTAHIKFHYPYVPAGPFEISRSFNPRTPLYDTYNIYAPKNGDTFSHAMNSC